MKGWLKKIKRVVFISNFFATDYINFHRLTTTTLLAWQLFLWKFKKSVKHHEVASTERSELTNTYKNNKRW
jgi:hypothetical protein